MLLPPRPVIGMDVTDHVVHKMLHANGPVASQAPGLSVIAQTALQQVGHFASSALRIRREVEVMFSWLSEVKGVLQTAAAIALTDIPPAIPPPVWNNQYNTQSSALVVPVSMFLGWGALNF